ncbi:MAG: sulfate ABC transporter permease subunit CysW [Deltaproteobacteria bacterium 13_1_20CM_2_69_21]|nr:MAG: sulfate ABC transporter permease subunit CysW [Deltaproteobacteria bacterium 13_1_40CM_68_24]OLC77994.1 MAG: sulfate ABC transporter permease subunit CysW [Deltaproteobacteria bacterium 13_1_40CM_4_68_19]OLD10680.1 MAG: sulfate ABC transporter permease subunit CysW [Deltaproteobacteria bacterium 13_1_40CM_3_69_14]OLD33901.1 MAG: sulfate ABC transporter permease subunit CysW [Myxococcales bacterium 13_1_40CM_2_68_15]OLE63055.1 MAG: sulfate ABC transporter permease subunit CysW [Deltaprot
MNASSPSARHSLPPALREPVLVRAALIAVGLAFLALFVLVPVAAVFTQALEKGSLAYLRAVLQPEVRAAMWLTLLCAAVAVPLNVAFGVAAAWAIARYEFPGKQLLNALIDLPFSVSPVISGLSLTLLFGAQGFFGPWLAAHGLKVVFAVPGIVLATTFVTFPFVAKEVLPVLQAQNADQEEAALTLGARGWQVFLRVTLPRIKWAVLYGVILCNARAMGEFGAVSVVSGHIRGRTNTLPLQVEILYNEYDFAGAFAVASMLTLLALVTLAAKKLLALRAREVRP